PPQRHVSPPWQGVLRDAKRRSIWPVRRPCARTGPRGDLVVPWPRRWAYAASGAVVLFSGRYGAPVGLKRNFAGRSTRIVVERRAGARTQPRNQTTAHGSQDPGRRR